MDKSAQIDEMITSYAIFGGRHYGEDVTQLDHMLQTAWHATRDRVGDSLVAAALLHDYGHFLERDGEEAAERGRDACHETIGARYLSRHFGPEVVQPIALHVQAKRYLCANDPTYVARLSPASRLSLELQGGPLDAAGSAAFRLRPYARDALRLRRYDDMGKVDGVDVPGIESYRSLLLSLV